MNRIFQIALFIVLISFISCEKVGINGVTTQPTEVAKGTIYATAAYTGVEPGNWVKFYVCDINYLDVISTMVNQMHNEAMDGNSSGYTSIYNSFIPNLQTLHTEVARDEYKFSYEIKPDVYVLLAERYVNYSYPKASIATDYLISSFSTLGFQYKVIKIESNMATNVAFIFQDFVSDAVDVYR